MDSNEKEETLRNTSARATGKGHGLCPGDFSPWQSRAARAAGNGQRLCFGHLLALSRAEPPEPKAMGSDS